ncbi:MAG: polysaccharide pyruvyl transferase family protein [Desulfuromusa sp.]|nr:polysaccharide pyruvyl transferase family protein [Desulfuromusa sp.]
MDNIRKVVLLNDTSFEQHHGCCVVIANIKTLLRERGLHLLATNPVGVPWEDNVSFRKKMDDSDIVLINGEGTIHHSQPRALDLITVVDYAKKHNKPTALINCTYQDNNDYIHDRAGLFDKVYVRESLSQDELRENGIQSSVVPDLTFFQEPFRLPTPRNGVGVTDSVDTEFSEKLYHFSKRQDMVYLPALAKQNFRLDRGTLRRQFKDLMKSVCFKALQMAGGSISFNRQRFLASYASTDRYINTIAKLELLMSARFHSCCFAVKTLTPMIAFASNSHKIQGMFKDIGLDSRRLIEQGDLGEPSDLNQYSQYSPKELHNLISYNKIAVEKINHMFDSIAKL